MLGSGGRRVGSGDDQIDRIVIVRASVVSLKGRRTGDDQIDQIVIV